MVLDEPNYFEIKRNKLLTVTMLIVAIGLIYYFSSRMNSDIENGSYGWIALDFIILYFACRTLYTQFIMLYKGKPRLSIKKSGIYLSLYGSFAKDDIKNVEISENEKGDIHFLIYLHDPEMFLENYKGVRKGLFKALYQQRGTPVAYQLHGMYDRAELEEAIKQFLEGTI